MDEIENHRTYVIYGKSGTGKTTLASSFPKPMLLIDVDDRGTDSISDVEDIDVVEIETFDQLEDLYYWLLDNPDEYKTVVMDTVTQLQEIVIKDVMRAKKKDLERAGDWGSMTKRDWGDASQKMKHWIVNFRNLPVEMVFIAQDRRDLDDEEDAESMLIPEIGPRLMGSVAKLLNAAVNVIAYTFIRLQLTKIDEGKGKTSTKRKIQYCLKLGPDPIVTTKVRKPKGARLQSVIVDPTYDDLIDAIEGE